MGSSSDVSSSDARPKKTKVKRRVKRPAKKSGSGSDSPTGDVEKDFAFADKSTIVMKIPDTEEFNLGLIQPLRFQFSFIGLSTASSPFYAVYRLIIFLLILIMPAQLIWAMVLPNNFTPSTLGGMAILSFASVFMYPAFVYYNTNDRFKKIFRLLLTLDTESDDRSRVYTNVIRWYGFGNLFFSVGFTVGWSIVFWLSFRDHYNDRGMVAFLIVHTIASIPNISVFITGLTVLLILTNMHRDQAALFIDDLRNGRINLRYATFFYNEMRLSLEDTCRAASPWLFPAVILLSSSLAFQIVGYLEERRIYDQFNGIFYIALSALALTFYLLSCASVSHKFDAVVFHSNKLFTTHFSHRADIAAFLAFAELSIPQYTVAGAPLTAAFGTLVVLGFFMGTGLFLREIFYIYHV